MIGICFIAHLQGESLKEQDVAKKPKENKKLLQLGQKARAGRLISEYIRAIGTEKTERVDVTIDVDTVEPQIISKAEAMVRDMWSKALKNDDAKEKLEYRKILIERIEGRPEANQEEGVKKKLSIPDRISDFNKDKLNEIAEKPAKKS